MWRTDESCPGILSRLLGGSDDWGARAGVMADSSRPPAGRIARGCCARAGVARWLANGLS